MPTEAHARLWRAYQDFCNGWTASVATQRFGMLERESVGMLPSKTTHLTQHSFLSLPS